jgi:hypothetical protein
MNDILSNLSEKTNKDGKEKCKGLFWRAYVNRYEQDGRIVVQRELRLLKSKSCKGCVDCGWFLEYMNDELDFEYTQLDNIEHGRIYTYKVHSSQGYYDTYPEIDGIEFVEVKNNV